MEAFRISPTSSVGCKKFRPHTLRHRLPSDPSISEACCVMLDHLMGAVAGSCKHSDKSVLILNSAENFLTNRLPAGFPKNNLIHAASFSYLVISRRIYHTDKNNGFYLAAFCNVLNSLSSENNYVSLPIS